jgi:spore photoproduct lyase
MFDNELGLAEILIDLIRERPQATLELKTKTDNIEKILNLDPAPNVVIAWSLNTPEIIKGDEKGSASLDRRLMAAKRVVEAGWKVAFHFDPLIVHPGWRDGYKKVVESLFAAAEPDKIAWISLGALRFHPSLKPIIKSRFPQSDLLMSQFVLCPDNKMRYVKPLRKELLAHVQSLIQSTATTVPLYFCMEGIEMWNDILGGSPKSLGMLDQVFG